MKTMKLTFYIYKDCIEETHNLNPDIFGTKAIALLPVNWPVNLN